MLLWEVNILMILNFVFKIWASELQWLAAIKEEEVGFWFAFNPEPSWDLWKICVWKNTLFSLSKDCLES